MIILNGKEYSRELINSYKNKVEILKSKKIIPSICVILVGNNYESELYVKMKKRECEQIGIKFTLFKYNETDNEEDIINKINECNNNIYVHGILVQLPLPKHMSNENIINTIDPKKDIDGLTSYNSGSSPVPPHAQSLASNLEQSLQPSFILSKEGTIPLRAFNLFSF